MRFLHTSDWHLGRSFHRVGMLGAQEAWVDHLVEVVRTEQVDAVIVAGDVYDRALPGVDVVALLDEALVRLTDAGAAVVISSGNHDSPRRLGFGSRLMERSAVHVRTTLTQARRPVLFEDRHGTLAVYALPYLEPALTAPELDCSPTHPQVMRAAMDGIRQDAASRGGRQRTVVAAHGVVVGGLPCDSERDITVAGVAAVPVAAFRGADYVALGHLHGRQELLPTLRYSGSPLPYSFSEHSHRKGSWLVNLGAPGDVRVEPVDAPVPRPLAVLRGRLPDLLADPDLTRHEGSWCQVSLTDPQRPREAMDRLRRRFPHTLELRWEPPPAPSARPTYTARVRGLDDVDVCCSFLEHVRGRAADTAETALLRAAVEAQRRADPEESGTAPRRRGAAPPRAGSAPVAQQGPMAGSGDALRDAG